MAGSSFSGGTSLLGGLMMAIRASHEYLWLLQEIAVLLKSLTER